ncbi:MAG: VWA domain-containing protein, partial [Planctomycetales bacterium]|nr:VWA domain-containing protein [Planctomycetales bacterium]
IYEELGVIEASGNEAFAKHSDKPLLSSVIAFGQNVTLRTEQPTDNLGEIKAAVEGIEMDTTGTENIFTAVSLAMNKYASYRQVDAETGEPLRNVMIVAFSDEVGDDQQGLEGTIQLCRKYATPVYVVGVPAPFGRKSTMVKWIDPDPNFDQSAQWGEVTQGPESLMPERLTLRFANRRDVDPIDSGFGPFALTRLCYQTGGIYFAVHPNRVVGREVSKNETAAMSAHFTHFFDPQIMRKYRPDYVSPEEYRRRLLENKGREALVRAAAMSGAAQLESPKTKFVRRDEAALINSLSEAQMAAAKLDPKVNAVVEMLKLGEVDRAKEDIPRWQAGYDLAMGRALAVKARVESYNELLAKARRGYAFEGKNNTLVLEPANEFEDLTSALAKNAEKAKMYLNRVIEEHPSTPWALLAKQELETPLAWRWKEEFTDLTPRAPGMGGNNNPAPRDDKLKMLDKPKAVRRPPRL